MTLAQRSMKPRILIVDDDSSIRTLLSVVASRSGVESDVAADGVEAVRRIQDNIRLPVTRFMRVRSLQICRSDRICDKSVVRLLIERVRANNLSGVVDATGECFHRTRIVDREVSSVPQHKTMECAG